MPQTPADLLAYQAIIYEQRDRGATWSFRQGTPETTVTVSGRVRVSAGEGIREGVLAGLGLAVASEWVFAPELKSGVVQAVRPRSDPREWYHRSQPGAQHRCRGSGWADHPWRPLERI